MTYEEIRETCEQVNMALEAAMAELEAFGNYDATPDEREGVSVKLECAWIMSGAVRDEREAA